MPGKAPTPDYVLREHGAGVQAVTFHSSLQILYSGCVPSISYQTCARVLQRGVTCAMHFVCFRDAEGFLIVWGLQDRRPILVRRYAMQRKDSKGTASCCRLETPCVCRPHSPQAGIICLLLLAEASVLLR